MRKGDKSPGQFLQRSKSKPPWWLRPARRAHRPQQREQGIFLHLDLHNGGVHVPRDSGVLPSIPPDAGPVQVTSPRAQPLLGRPGCAERGQSLAGPEQLLSRPPEACRAQWTARLSLQDPLMPRNDGGSQVLDSSPATSMSATGRADPA